MNKKLLSLLLAALLISCSLISVSCSEKPNAAQNSGTKAESATSSEVYAETTEAIPEWVLPDTDWDGKTITFILRTTPDDWSADDVIAEEINATTINDAVYERNSRIEEKYNAVISGYNAPVNHSVYNPVLASVQAGDDSFDVITSYAFDSIKFMQENVIIDLDSTKYLNLDQSWWNPFYSEKASMLGHRYYALGDISRVYKLGVRCFFFNKDLLKNLQLENVYDLVRDDKWTYEKMFSMASSAYSDLDGDGTRNKADRYGIQAQSSLGIVLAIGGNMRITGKDENGLPILTVDSNDNIEILNSVQELMNANKDSIYDCNVWLETQKRFSSNQALFQAEVMLLIEALRASDVDIGIIPTPKATSEQETYVSYLDSYCQNVYSIPVTCDDTDFVSFMLEVMAQGSTDTLTPAFYDICLNGKYIRDEDSSEMLDIIFKYCRSENAETYGWGNMYNKLYDVLTKSTGVASTIAGAKEATNIAIEKTVTKIKENLG